MSDTRHLLERGVRDFEPGPEGYERVLRRRDRRERRRRVEAGALGLLVFALLAASVVAAVRMGQQDQPATGPITPSDVAQLRLVWSGKVGGPIDAPMTVAGDRLYVMSQGRLSAFATSCAQPSADCPAVWSARLPESGISGTFNLWWGAPTVSGSTVYVGGGGGRALGFPTACTGTCDPSWRATTGGTSIASPPVVAGDTVYLGVDMPTGHGRLEAFPAACGGDHTCQPTWFGDLPGGFTGSTPVVADGAVFVGSADGTLQAFPVDCATSGRPCAPRWSFSLASAAPGELGAMVSPLGVDGGQLFAASGYRLYAFPLACTQQGSVCPPRWTAHLAGYVDGLAIADGQVFASSFEDRSVHVFSASCATPSCVDPWTISDTGMGSNALATGGVVYVGASHTGVAAYVDDCGTAAGTCHPLWSGTTGATVSAGLATVGDALFVGDEDGGVYAFAIHGLAIAGPGAAAPSPHPSAWFFLFYLVAIAGLLVLGYRAIRRRRERTRTSVPI